MSVTHATIPDLIIDAIKANATLLAAIGQRVHYQTIPQSSQYPHVYLARTGRDTEDFLDGSDGPTEDSFVLEFVAESFEGNLCSALYDTLSSLEGQLPDGTWIYCTDVLDVDDNYVFKSADSDALFLHAFQVTVYHS
jgi:hypothetical protein